MKISELFYSLQGEGVRAGAPTVFVRLSGCSAKHACYASGVRCDTEFESGREMSADEILDWIRRQAPQAMWITWTGGEPLDQLDEETIRFFRDAGFRQALETSGLKPAPAGLDVISVSPKVAEHVLRKNFPDGVTELRYVRHAGQSIPEPAITAEHYFLSPHFDGMTPNEENIRHCVRLCLEHPGWRLSLQQHKLWRVL